MTETYFLSSSKQTEMAKNRREPRSIESNRVLGARTTGFFDWLENETTIVLDDDGG
jgi:hypothetical protein